MKCFKLHWFKPILLCILTEAIVYLFFAFCSWQINWMPYVLGIVRFIYTVVVVVCLITTLWLYFFIREIGVKFNQKDMNDKLNAFHVGDKVEHICKESASGYPHDKQYYITGFCRMKDPTTRKWVDGVCYSAGEEVFVREKGDFQTHFQLVKNINHD